MKFQPNILLLYICTYSNIVATYRHIISEYPCTFYLFSNPLNVCEVQNKTVNSSTYYPGSISKFEGFSGGRGGRSFSGVWFSFYRGGGGGGGHYLLVGMVFIWDWKKKIPRFSKEKQDSHTLVLDFQIYQSNNCAPVCVNCRSSNENECWLFCFEKKTAWAAWVDRWCVNDIQFQLLCRLFKIYKPPSNFRTMYHI